MIPCIGDIWQVDYGGRKNFVLVTHVTGERWDDTFIDYQVLRGNGQGQKGWLRLAESERWRWRKVTN